MPENVNTSNIGAERAPKEVAEALEKQLEPDDVHPGEEYGDPYIYVDFNEDAIQARRDPANNFAHRGIIPANPKGAIARALTMRGGRAYVYPSPTAAGESQSIFSFASRQEIEDALHNMVDDVNLIWALRATGFPDVARVVEFRAVRKDVPESLQHLAPFNCTVRVGV
eukprot:tig00020629_g12477.t1